MGAFINLVRQRFDRLLVMSRGPNAKSGHAQWWCLCECGFGVLVVSGDLQREHTRSCGCLRGRHERMGKNSPNWKGGITPESKVVRSSAKYSEWRTQVFERDEYTCQKCGQRGGVLNAHHIEGFNNNPELRTEVLNGITFCADCHDDFHHQFGKGNNTENQLNTWLKYVIISSF